MSGNPPAEQPRSSGAARASVVIPAHNEEKVLTRCLQSLADQPGAADIEVVVAANGCTDNTVAVGRAFTELPRLVVLDLPEPSKSGALNAGDDAATAFPRIYLDADITLGPGALQDLITALDIAEPRIASPRIRFDLSRSSLPVRQFFAMFTELPYVKSGLVGLGVYGMSASGRARFNRFPDIAADDLFAQRVFTPAERVIVDSEFTVTAPRDLPNLVKVRTRVARGNAELTTVKERPDEADFESTTGGTVNAMLALVRSDPRMLPPAVCYLCVTTLARVRAALTRTATTWDRDTSTR